MNLGSAVRAFPIIVLQSWEPLRAVRELAQTFQERASILVWDILGGTRPFEKWAQPPSGENPVGRDLSSPLSPIKYLHDTPSGAPTILAAINYHLAWRSRPDVIQALLDGCRIWSGDSRRFVVVCPPGAEIPPEIRRYVQVIDHEIPSEEDLVRIIEANIEAQERLGLRLRMPKEQIRAVARMGLGLTAFEFANALAVSIAEHRAVRLDVIAAQKEQIIRQTEALEWVRSEWTFSDIGGLEAVKCFLRMSVGKPGARGVLFLGVPGVGKTMTAFAAANEAGLPAFLLSFARVFGSLVGESEQRIRRALQTVDAMGPCIVIIDELEKGLAGVGADAHVGDSGTTKRVGGEFLTWLSSPEREAYVIATCNDITSLPAEYTRPGRWDAVFFFDLPTPEEREAIVRIYAGKYGVSPEPRPDAPGWTGAEIECAFRLARMWGHKDTREAREYVTPLFLTMQEQVEALRRWAQGRAKPASDVGSLGREATEVVRVVA